MITAKDKIPILPGKINWMCFSIFSKKLTVFSDKSAGMLSGIEVLKPMIDSSSVLTVSYTHLRAHET